MDRHFAIDGYLIADAEIPISQPLANTSQRDRLLLFGDERSCTLLTLHRLTTWGEGGPERIYATTGSITTYFDLDMVRAMLPRPTWQALVDAAARNGAVLSNPAPPLGDL
jgi:hypothetical protein